MKQYIEQFSEDIHYTQPTSHFIYGDSTDCFYWACQLAQSFHSRTKHRVFMTSATKDNFMEGYQDEGCLILLGVNPQAVPADELQELLRFIEIRTFMGVDTSFLHTVIFVAHTDLEGMAAGYGKQRDTWAEVCNVFDNIYEVRNAGKFGVANVTAYQYTPNETGDQPGTLEAKMIDRGVDLLQFLDMKNAANDYFEKYNYNGIWAGMPEELTCFLRQVKYLPIFEQQKLWAMMNSHAGTTVSPMFAKHCLQNLRSCEYAPGLRTVKDCGYQQIRELGEEKLKSELQVYIDFEEAGTVWLENEEHEDGQLTPFGYIRGLPPYDVQQEFIIPFDPDRLYFEPNCLELWELGKDLLPF